MNSRSFALLLPFLFLLMVGIGFPYCYQESANVSNQSGTDGTCSLVYNGNYSTSGGTNWVNTPENLFDGNWSSGLICDAPDGGFYGYHGHCYYYANYSVPVGANSVDNLLQTEYSWSSYYGDRTDNFTIDADCMARASITGVVQIYADITQGSGYSGNPPATDQVNWYCVGTSGNVYIGGQGTDLYHNSGIKEEGIYWNIVTSPKVQLLYVSPYSPLGNDTLNCNANITDGDNATFTAQVNWIINGGIWGSTISTAVTSGVQTIVSSLPPSQIQVGDNVSCRVRGFDGVNYGEEAYSNIVNVRGYSITGIATSPEPTLFGGTKLLNFTTGRNTYTTRVEFTRPSGSTGEYYAPESSKTIHSVQLNSDALSPYFNESGSYTFTIKSCECPSGDFDSISCSEDMCAVPSDYPLQSRTMRFSISNYMYLYDTAILNANLEYGKTQQIFSKFSKPVNIFKAVVTYPDTSTRTFRTILNNETTSSIFLTSGQNKDLNQSGTYSVDLYAGFGWHSDTSDCLETAECSYDNSTMGLAFNVVYGTGGFIDNLTLIPTPPVYTTDLNITFGTTNKTDSTCVTFHKPITYIPQKKRIVSANTTSWNIPVTTGDTKYLNSNNLYDLNGNAVGWSYDIKSCANNGSSVCQNSDCSISSTYNCAYCIESTNNSILFANASIYNVTYKSQIAVGESQIINFHVSPPSNHTQIHFPSLILGEQDIDYSRASSVAESDWSITIPYSIIQEAICTANVSTCVYGNIPFVVRSYQVDENNNLITLQSESFRFDVNTSTLLEQGMAGNEGTPLGQMMGRAFGIGGIGGDMILAIAISMIFTIIIAVFVPANPIIPVAVFVSFMCGFSLIGMLPIWIPVILILICGALVVKVVSGIGGGD